MTELLVVQLPRVLANLTFAYLERDLLGGLSQTERRIIDWLIHHLFKGRCEKLVVNNWNAYERSRCYCLCRVLGLRFKKEIIHRSRDRRFGYKQITVFL